MLCTFFGPSTRMTLEGSVLEVCIFWPVSRGPKHHKTMEEIDLCCAQKLFLDPPGYVNAWRWKPAICATKTRFFLLAQLACLVKPFHMSYSKPKSGRWKKSYYLINAINAINAHTKFKNSKYSKSNSENANRLDVPKSGPNPFSDQEVDFSQKWVPGCHSRALGGT